jgi:hypothetical protein
MSTWRKAIPSAAVPERMLGGGGGLAPPNLRTDRCLESVPIR